MAGIYAFDDISDAVCVNTTPGRVGKVLLRP